MSLARFLLVDDEPDFRMLTRLVLEDHGHEVVGEAGGGKEAVGLARRLRADAILLDLNMPGVSGLEALPRLRAAAPASKVVILSVVTEAGPLHQAKMAGAHAFVSKTLDNEAFVEAVEMALKASGWRELRG